jgi:hypothetical protein
MQPCARVRARRLSVIRWARFLDDVRAVAQGDLWRRAAFPAGQRNTPATMQWTYSFSSPAGSPMKFITT